MRLAPALIAASLLAAPAFAEDRPVAEQYLISGDLAGGDTFLSAHLAGNPNDAQARFGLGAIRFVRSIEKLVQGFHRFGLQPEIGNALPFARLPIPPNPNPEPVAYDDIRKLFADFVADLANAESTLAGVTDASVRLPIRFGLVRLDLDGDGNATEDEVLWKLYTRLNAQAQGEKNDPKANDNFEVVFDRGDVAWLRGYCHLLMSFGEVYLAHDMRALFDHSAHLFFPRPKTPFPFLKPDPEAFAKFQPSAIGDAIAFVHLLRFPVAEPARMANALAHLEAMTRLSRESWAAYLAETDNQREWIPNPRQDTVMPGGKVTDEMVKGWMTFLDEADSILAGKTLIPFWRDAGGKGINLRRVFAEPREMDPILWFQGTAAAPYLEDGPVTSAETWTRLQRIFRGEFIGFALWFN